MKTFLLLSLLFPTSLIAQSTTSFFLSQEAMKTEAMGQDLTRIDLIKAASQMGQAQSLEIQSVKVEGSTGVGGAQVFLRINNEFVDSDSLESMKANEVVKTELKNIERAELREASLVLQSASNLRLKSVEVILGQVSEPVLFGRYNEDAIQQVAQAGSTGARPSAEVVSGLYQKYYIGDAAAVNVAPAPQQTVTVTPAQPVYRPQVVTQGPGHTVYPVQPQTRPQTSVNPRVYVPPPRATTTTTTTLPSPCVTNRRGERICIGDRVINRVFIDGVVRGLDRSTNPAQLIILFDLSDGTVRRDADSVRKK